MGNFSLGDADAPLAIDTSVSINLAACGIAPRLLRALGRRVVVVRTVTGELEDGGERGQVVLAAIEQWQRDGLLTVVDLQERSHDAFEQLITGSTTVTIDDGEAATIAHALHITGIAVVDDGKARRIGAQRFPSLRLASTADLMLNPPVVDSLGDVAIADALFNALTGARMRVLPHNVSAVVSRLGPERVAMCHSLPRSVRRSD